jgi:hypothetical protein
MTIKIVDFVDAVRSVGKKLAITLVGALLLWGLKTGFEMYLAYLTFTQASQLP